MIMGVTITLGFPDRAAPRGGFVLEVKEVKPLFFISYSADTFPVAALMLYSHSMLP